VLRESGIELSDVLDRAADRIPDGLPHAITIIRVLPNPPAQPPGLTDLVHEDLHLAFDSRHGGVIVVGPRLFQFLLQLQVPCPVRGKCVLIDLFAGIAEGISLFVASEPTGHLDCRDGSPGLGQQHVKVGRSLAGE